MNYIDRYLTFVIILAASFVQGQETISTIGTEFWFGFMQNTSPGDGGGNMIDVYVSAEQDTEGTLEIPAQGYTQPFSVSANSVTILEVSLDMAEHITNEQVDNKGLYLSANDTVSVFAINQADASHDATNVLPVQMIGTHYRITSYQSYIWDNGSEFLIVATEDETEIMVIPTYETLNGIPAGTPFAIELNAGESYQVRSNHPLADYTGTTIYGSDDCKPFAVFSGTANAYVPSTCSDAADHIFTQSLPIDRWGMDFVVVPFAESGAYTLKILADEDNTTVSINGSNSMLNAGEVLEINDLYVPNCITADKPINVTQFMQSLNCTQAGSMNGDPSMCRIDDSSNKIYNIAFKATDILYLAGILDPTYYLNVVTESEEIDNIFLDGIPIDESEFDTFPSCPDYSYAQIFISDATHHLEAANGVAAYVYGMIEAESSLYSLGAYNPNPPTSNEPDSISLSCQADSIVLIADNGDSSTIWYLESLPEDTLGSGPELELFQPIVSGMYVAAHCTSNELFHLENEGAFNVSVEPADTSLCEGDSIQINVNVEPDPGDLNFSWTPTDGINMPDVANPVISPDQTTIYTLTVESDSLCSVEADIEIIINESIDLDITVSQDTLCPGETVQLNTALMGASLDSIMIQWQPSEGLSDSSILNPIATVDDNITYTLTVEDIISGCASQDQIDLVTFENFSIDAGADQAICADENAMLNAFSDSDIPLTWQWNNSNLLNDHTLPNPMLIVNENADFIVVATDSNGCTQSDTTSVSFIAPPEVNLPEADTICQGEQLVLNAGNSGAQYDWNTNENTQNITVDSDGIYSVTVTNGEGCISSDQTEIFITEFPEFELGQDIIGCIGDTAFLATDIDNMDYLWNTGQTSQSIAVTTSGFYSLTISNNQCEASDSIYVGFHEPPEFHLPQEITYCFEECPDQLVLNPGGEGVTYLWNTSETTASIKIDQPGTYSVEITTAEGCEQVLSSIVKQSCNRPLYVPNAFTPNEDGINDLFGVEGADPVEDFELKIWNRWGELVWATQNQFEKWNGAGMNGEHYVQNGLYSYSLTYKYDVGCRNNKPTVIEKVGHVTVIR